MASLGILILISCLCSVRLRVGAATNYRVVAYIDGDDQFNVYQTIDYAKITHLIYSEVLVQSESDPSLIDGSETSFGMLYKIQNKAKSVNPNIKYMASLVGGDWNSFDDGHLTAIMANYSLRSQLVANLISLVSTYSLDGVDIDWEGDDVVAADYAAFLDALKSALPTGKIISVTGLANITASGWFSPATVTNDVTMVNIMMYDISRPQFATLSDTITYLNTWLNNGFTASKLNLGIPVYASDNTQNLCSYGQVISQLNPDNNLNQQSVSTINGFAGNGLTVQGGILWWNGYNLATLKTALAESENLGGIMMYTIDYDAIGNSKSLLNAVYNELNPFPPPTTNTTASSTSTTTNTTASSTSSTANTAASSTSTTTNTAASSTSSTTNPPTTTMKYLCAWSYGFCFVSSIVLFSIYFIFLIRILSCGCSGRGTKIDGNSSAHDQERHRSFFHHRRR
jgi:hypothetical protein